MVIIPHRGDVVWLDFEPQLGREIKKASRSTLKSLQVQHQNQTCYLRTNNNPNKRISI
jgi:mRNA-degrading endonuclease toxin of MazEF toxin-antitoxin module